MKPITLLQVAAGASVISAYIITAPVYAVKRNIEGKPRAMRAREEQLRRRLLSRSQPQKVIKNTVFGLSDARPDSISLDLCEVSNCEQLHALATDMYAGSPDDDEDDVYEDNYFEGSAFPLLSWDVDELAQVTEISLGTPPQKIKVIISISDNDLFVPSSECDSSYCVGHQKYNASLSRTYHDTGRRSGLPSLWHIPHYSGPLSQDTLRIAGMEIKDQLFAEGDDVWYFDEDQMLNSPEGWDGYLGLAPSNNGSFAGISNAFQNMVSSGALDQNLFSLKLSRGPDDPGELVFGGVNHDLFTGELKELHIVNDSDELQRVKGRWNVPFGGISIGEGSVKYDDYVATLESDFPFIALPENDVILLNRYLGMEVPKGESGPIWSIDCLKRKKLEVFTITLGGQDFVIGPYEYTLEVYLEQYGEVRCVSAFQGIPSSFTSEKYVILGSAFLRNFYTVFDPMAGTVKLGVAAVPKNTRG